MKFTNYEAELLVNYICGNGFFSVNDNFLSADEHKYIENFLPTFNILNNNHNVIDIEIDEQQLSLLFDYLSSNGYLAGGDVDDCDLTDPYYEELCNIYEKIKDSVFYNFK